MTSCESDPFDQSNVGYDPNKLPLIGVVSDHLEAGGWGRVEEEGGG